MSHQSAKPSSWAHVGKKNNEWWKMMNCTCKGCFTRHYITAWICHHSCIVCLQYPLVVVMILTGEIYQLINFASFARWFFIALATLGMLIHRYRFPLHPRPFKVSTSLPFKFFHCALKLTKLLFDFALFFLTTRRCPWSSPSPSRWFASSSWACLCTLTPGTQGGALFSHWPGFLFTIWPSTATACPINGGKSSVSCTRTAHNWVYPFWLGTDIVPFPIYNTLKQILFHFQYKYRTNLIREIEKWVAWTMLVVTQRRK